MKLPPVDDRVLAAFAVFAHYFTRTVLIGFPLLLAPFLVAALLRGIN